VADEVAEHLALLAERRGLDAPLLLAALSVMPVDWQAPEAYEPARPEAEHRMAGRDPDDWPTVALALARSLPIWSQTRTWRRPASPSSRPESCWTPSARRAARSSGVPITDELIGKLAGEAEAGYDETRLQAIEPDRSRIELLDMV
jgi:hypothetical protein